MGILVALKGLGGSASAQDAEDAGALDHDQVLIQFLCQTIGGGHDPEGEPDDAVRPTHAALHGTYWTLDDANAPIPPLDYGCRCAIRYVAKRGTIAARALDTVADAPPETDPADTYRTWLGDNVANWQAIAEKVAKVPRADRLGKAYLLLRDMGIASARDVARMLVQTL